MRGSGLSHTTTQRRRESISQRMHLSHVILYIHSIQPVLHRIAGLRHETPTPGVSVLILTNHFKSLPTYLQVQVLSFNITRVFHHGVVKSIHAGDSHSPFSFPKTRPFSRTSPSTRGDLICHARTPVTNHIASPEHMTSQQTTRAHVSP